MAEKKPREPGDQFWRVGRRNKKVYSRERWEQLQERSRRWIRRQLKPYRTEWERRSEALNRVSLRKIFSGRWLAESEYADLGAMWLRYRIADLEAEHDYRKRQSELYITFNPVLRYKRRAVDRFTKRLTQAPREMSEIQAEVDYLTSLSNNLKNRFKREQKFLDKSVKRDKGKIRELKKVSKARKNAVREAMKSREKLGTLSRVLEQMVNLGRMDVNAMERELWPGNVENAEGGMRYAEADRDLWTFWHRHAVEKGSDADYIKELARRIHNARESYISAKEELEYWKKHRPKGT
ncbi:MAG: hypothetical protein JXB14_03185 [Candidatus Altiarchaeota archaeon]|nr:hypothetical protein [Candidatus Altiarchaeota archaeon]